MTRHRSYRILSRLIVILAFSGLLVPTPLARANDPAKAAARAIHDIRLDRLGSLSGSLVDEKGSPIEGRRVVLQRDGKPLVETRTDKQGVFSFAKLTGGMYQLRLVDSAVTCRVWTRDAAPPAARDRLVVIDAPSVVRGQQPISEIFSNPLLVGLVIATAIAIPIAVHNSQDDDPSGS